MKIAEAANHGNTAFEPKRAQNKDSEKFAAYYRFTTTELDREASIFKEAIIEKTVSRTSVLSTSLTTFTAIIV